MIVYICSINSSFYDDKISHIDRVYENQDQAEAWKKNYEKEMEDYKDMTIFPPADGSDKELDRYSLMKRKHEEAVNFISIEIKPFKVL